MAPEKKNKEKIVPIRMEENLANLSKELAADRGISLAGLVRGLLIKELKEAGKG